MKQLYELLTYPLSVIEDPLLDFIFISILGSISFVIAWNFVGDSGIRGKAGSILHWTVRIIVMFTLCAITSMLIKLINFIQSISINVWITIFVTLIILSIIVVIIYFTIFSKCEKEKRIISKNKNRYLTIMKRIVNNYYLKHDYKIKKEEIIISKLETEIFNDIEKMLIEEKLLVKEKDEITIEYRTVLFLEKYIRESMNYTIASLAFIITFISLFVNFLSNYNNPFTEIISIILLVFMIGFIFSLLPKDKIK